MEYGEIWPMMQYTVLRIYGIWGNLANDAIHCTPDIWNMGKSGQ